jgi:hypothetical protein
MSFGASQLAACGADVKSSGPTAIYRAFNNTALFANMTAAGTLLIFPGNPAVNSTPYTQQCSNLSAS